MMACTLLGQEEGVSYKASLSPLEAKEEASIAKIQTILAVPEVEAVEAAPGASVALGPPATIGL